MTTWTGTLTMSRAPSTNNGAMKNGPSPDAPVLEDKQELENESNWDRMLSQVTEQCRMLEALQEQIREDGKEMTRVIDWMTRVKQEGEARDQQWHNSTEKISGWSGVEHGSPKVEMAPPHATVEVDDRAPAGLEKEEDDKIAGANERLHWRSLELMDAPLPPTRSPVTLASILPAVQEVALRRLLLSWLVSAIAKTDEQRFCCPPYPLVTSLTTICNMTLTDPFRRINDADSRIQCWLVGTQVSPTTQPLGCSLCMA